MIDAILLVFPKLKQVYYTDWWGEDYKKESNPMPMSTTFEIALEARGRDWLHIKVFGMSSTAIDHFSHFEAVLWALLESSNAGQAYVAN